MVVVGVVCGLLSNDKTLFSFPCHRHLTESYLILLYSIYITKSALSIFDDVFATFKRLSYLVAPVVRLDESKSAYDESDKRKKRRGLTCKCQRRGSRGKEKDSTMLCRQGLCGSTFGAGGRRFFHSGRMSRLSNSVPLP